MKFFNVMCAGLFLTGLVWFMVSFFAFGAKKMDMVVFNIGVMVGAIGLRYFLGDEK
jgi:hypothetical protein